MQIDKLNYYYLIIPKHCCCVAGSYLSIFSSQVERGPKVVVSRMRICPILKQHTYHIPVSTGTCYV